MLQVLPLPKEDAARKKVNEIFQNGAAVFQKVAAVLGKVGLL